jgi:probable F420-dependent oxidoreductase
LASDQKRAHRTIADVERTLRFGCVAVTPPPTRAEWAERVRRIDGWGYDTVLVADHLSGWPPFPALVAAGEVSSRLRLGTQVLNVGFWNPVLVAREAAAADVLTDGRLELGLGAGHAEAEFLAAGLRYPPAGERVDRLAEMVSTVRRLLGEHPADDVCLATRQPRVPLMVGGNGDRVLDIGARHADIVSLVGFRSGTGQHHTDLSHFDWAGLADRVARVRAAAGDRFADLELSILVQAVRQTDERTAEVGRMAAAFEQAEELIADSPFVMMGSAAQMTEHVLRLRSELGVTYVTTFEPSAAALATVVARAR